MNIIKGKAILLIFLLAILIGLLFIWLQSSGTVMQEEEIVEKYYSPDGSGKVTGITTKEIEEVNADASGPTCAMKFSNNKILVLDCDRYLNYRIGEKVEIAYDNRKITEIRGKE
ncbi:hypothetical protein ELQ35_14175 [Peribacillus cavernae]|uniref:Uncharacterized protein n=1 Tax=Peribacillus cavernae TaxID=1674310 RepID=A0A433HIG2_9BACI|nr:hypothetical protein [Peribacillus cavernae]MDQ0220444.1 hypothetical protein [Peribacillus cavernae]RUQ28049.1 hypothetical protein ELQ35_14175 [Peribacillus cavernae]